MDDDAEKQGWDSSMMFLWIATALFPPACLAFLDYEQWWKGSTGKLHEGPKAFNIHGIIQTYQNANSQWEQRAVCHLNINTTFTKPWNSFGWKGTWKAIRSDLLLKVGPSLKLNPTLELDQVAQGHVLPVQEARVRGLKRQLCKVARGKHNESLMKEQCPAILHRDTS